MFPRIEKLREDSDFAIIGGDWNISLNQKLDTYGYMSENNPRAKNKVLELMEKSELMDIFREMHPENRRFSWRQFRGNKRSRLDFFLTSPDLLPFVEDTDIIPAISSDHSMPSLIIDFSRFQRGKGFFIFNNSLLGDKDYVLMINETIKSVTSFYAEDLYDKSFLEKMSPEEQQNIVLNIDPQLFLECLLLEIRGKTIGYCAWQKKNKLESKRLATQRLELLEKASDRDPVNEKNKHQLEVAKEEVYRFIQQETEAAACRARAQWQIDGEKPTKFFCSLEKFNAAQKYIPLLATKDANGKEQLIKDQKAIDGEIYNYYKNLYKSHEDKINRLTIDGFLGTLGNKIPKLTEKQSKTLEGLLTIQEATDYIKKCRADASPGSSGFTGAFFKVFWRHLKHFVVNSLNYAFETGSLSVSQKLGVVILLPKPEKDKRNLSNWRPISLLNQTYKILSGALAERIKNVLPDIINEDQKGFVRGRFMGECIRNTYDVMDYAKNNNMAGLILLIDFEKAFDSISHTFILKALHFFGFGYSFLKWINVLLNEASSCINHCGNITKRFKIERSCRQGDPISPYLFIVCVEILAIKIREDSLLKGFNIGNYVKKLDFYADDLTAYLVGTEASLRRMIVILDEFFNLSGLKINLAKCKAV